MRGGEERWKDRQCAWQAGKQGRAVPPETGRWVGWGGTWGVGREVREDTHLGRAQPFTFAFGVIKPAYSSGPQDRIHRIFDPFVSQKPFPPSHSVLVIAQSSELPLQTAEPPFRYLHTSQQHSASRAEQVAQFQITENRPLCMIRETKHNRLA